MDRWHHRQPPGPAGVTGRKCQRAVAEREARGRETPGRCSDGLERAADVLARGHGRLTCAATASRNASSSTARASVAAVVIGFVVDEIRNNDPRLTGSPSTASVPIAPCATSSTSPGTLSSPTCDAATAASRSSPSSVSPCPLLAPDLLLRRPRLRTSGAWPTHRRQRVELIDASGSAVCVGGVSPPGHHDDPRGLQIPVRV